MSADRSPRWDGVRDAIADDSQRGIIRSQHRRLLEAGFTPDQAANLLAHAIGLAIVGQPWNLHELLAVVWFREQVRAGHRGPNDGGLNLGTV